MVKGKKYTFDEFVSLVNQYVHIDRIMTRVMQGKLRNNIDYVLYTEKETIDIGWKETTKHISDNMYVKVFAMITQIPNIGMKIT